jgi:aldose 1-epimerase
MFFAAGIGCLFAAGCASTSHKTDSITQQPFGRADGREIELYTLKNASGVEAKIMNYGGIVVSLKMPDRNGQTGDVVLGYDTLAQYVANNSFFGALIGRCANRIAGARFTLDGTTYTLTTNNPPNHLHGGTQGFFAVVWDARPFQSLLGPALEMHYHSQDGEQGYPGNLEVTAVYTLTDKNELRVDFKATTDKPTIVNMTDHPYFNLAGHGDVLGHVLRVDADTFTPINATLVPTGEIRPVDGTPFDFRKPTAIGARIHGDDEQLKLGHGYDHNWIINKPSGQLALMARVYEPTSGRVLEVLSTEPAVQFYSGNGLDGTLTGKGGQVYQRYTGFCLEPQHYPDSPNHPSFPTVVLRPGEVYRNTIVFRFSTM